MKRDQLQNRLAQLESIHDHLLTEVDYVDKLMRLLGFAQGLQSVKLAAKEIIEKGYLEKEISPEEESEI